MDHHRLPVRRTPAADLVLPEPVGEQRRLVIRRVPHPLRRGRGRLLRRRFAGEAGAEEPLSGLRRVPGGLEVPELGPGGWQTGEHLAEEVVVSGGAIVERRLRARVRDLPAAVAVLQLPEGDLGDGRGVGDAAVHGPRHALHLSTAWLHPFFRRKVYGQA